MSSLISVQIRRGTRAEWEASNAVLLEGEIGFESNTYRFKIGKRDLFTRDLIPWNLLEYASPYSGKQKPVYPQTGDFWIEQVLDEDDKLYFFDGLNWLPVGTTRDPHFEGSINIEDGCFVGDLLPCMDAAYNIGAETSRWKDGHFSDSIVFTSTETDRKFVIKEGISTEAGNVTEYTRLQLDGDDIAVRADFENVTSYNLNLFRLTGDDGQIQPQPKYLEQYGAIAPVALPPQGNIQTQSQYNEWVYVALQSVDDSVNSITGTPGSCLTHTDFYNTSEFHCQLIADRGVNVPLDSSTETNVDSGDIQSKFFLRADGTVSDKLPLEQSYWTNVPRL